mmetsp:Transcript_68871/g.128566  ORF Transcript_68871/g.128566 Transcript_68871/m.128566 type:complete len:310 (-) Transcript_68871:200-1129(-)
MSQSTSTPSGPTVSGDDTSITYDIDAQSNAAQADRDSMGGCEPSRQSAQAARRRNPGRLCIAFDLNHLLVCAPFPWEASPEGGKKGARYAKELPPHERIPVTLKNVSAEDGNKRLLFLWIRPYAQALLEGILRHQAEGHCRLAFYTAWPADWAKEVVNKLLPGEWDWDGGPPECVRLRRIPPALGADDASEFVLVFDEDYHDRKPTFIKEKHYITDPPAWDDDDLHESVILISYEGSVEEGWVLLPDDGKSKWVAEVERQPKLKDWDSDTALEALSRALEEELTLWGNGHQSEPWRGFLYGPNEWDRTY